MDQVAGENFEQLPLARAELPDVLSGQYRVYSDHTNFKLVQAISAINALEMSGLSQAFKIVREALHKTTLIVPKKKEAGADTPPAAEQVPSSTPQP